MSDQPIDPGLAPFDASVLEERLEARLAAAIDAEATWSRIQARIGLDQVVTPLPVRRRARRVLVLAIAAALCVSGVALAATGRWSHPVGVPRTVTHRGVSSLLKPASDRGTGHHEPTSNPAVTSPIRDGSDATGPSTGDAGGTTSSGSVDQPSPPDGSGTGQGSTDGNDQGSSGDGSGQDQQQGGAGSGDGAGATGSSGSQDASSGGDQGTSAPSPSDPQS